MGRHWQRTTWALGTFMAAMGMGCLGSPGAVGVATCCVSQTDCEDGYLCAQGVCSAACVGNEQCSQGEACDTTLGACVPLAGRGGLCQGGAFGGSSSGVVVRDAGGLRDAAGEDAHVDRRDAGSWDRWVTIDDAGPVADASIADASMTDAAGQDASRPDAGRPDASRPDASRPDASRPDSGRPDASRPDSGRPDGGAQCNPQDMFEPNNSLNTAATVPGGSSWTAAVCGPDQDFFNVPSAPGDQVSLVVVPSNPGALLTVQLLTPQGQVVANGTSGPGGVVTVFVPSALGRMVLVVRSVSAVTLPYSCTLDIQPGNTCTPDSFEPNDTEAQAAPVNGTAAARICEMDVDHFQVQVPVGGGRLVVDMVMAADAGDLDLVVLDPMGNEVGASQNGTGQPEHLDLQLSSGGRYVIRVYGWPPGSADAGQGSYVLTASVTSAGCMDDPLEPNNDINQAVPINGGVDAVICPMDLDYFASPNGNNGALVRVFEAAGQVNVRVLTPGGQVLVTGSGTTFVLTVPSGPPLLLVEVRQAFQIAAGTPYTLIVEPQNTQMCVGADGFEPNNTVGTAVLVPPQNVAGQVCGADQDWFRTQGADGDVVTAAVRAMGPVEVSLHAANGALLATGAPQPDGTVAAFLANAPADVRARVRSSSPVEVAYQLLLIRSSATCIPDSFEPNDTAAQASAFNGSASATICEMDVDHYQVQVPPGGGRLVVDMDMPPQTGDLDLVVLDPMGNEVARSENGQGQPEHVDVQLPVGGRYVIRVYGWPPGSPNADQGPYVLTASVTGGGVCINDPQEPNNALNQAWPIIGGVDAVVCPMDVDVFAAPNGNNGARVRLSGAPAPVRVRVLTPAGQVLTTGSGTNLTLLVPSGAPLLMVEVTQLAAVASGTPYTLFVEPQNTQMCQGTDAFEPNNTVGAAVLVPPQNVSGQVCGPDEDWFRTQGAAGDQVTAVVRAMGPVELTLHSSNGTLLATATPEPNGGFLAVLPNAPADVRARVRSPSLVDVAYQLLLTRSSVMCPADAFEPNDTLQSASPLPNQADINANICPMDTDHYAIDLVIPSRLTVDMFPAANSGDLDLELLDSNGMQLDVSQASQGAEHILLDLPAGRYVAHVYGWPPGGDTTGDYNLTVLTETGMCVEDPFEENDTPAQATPLVAPLVGRVCPGDPDVFRFTPNPNAGDVVITLEPLPTRVSFFMEVRDGMGTLLRSIQTGTNPVNLTAPGNVGPLFITLSGSVGNNGGPYRLGATQQPQMCTGADAFEPNNNAGEAEPYVSPAMAGTLCNGDEDWFLVPSRPSETVTAIISGGVPGTLQIRTQAGQVLGSGMSLPGGGFGAVAVNVTGAVYVRIVDNGPNPLNYSLAVNRVGGPTCLPDNYEPNNSQATARPATGLVQAQICANDVDWFSFTTTSPGAQVSLAMLTLPGAGNLELRLFSPNGQLLARNPRPAGTPETIDITVGAAGTYGVQVVGVGGATGAYGLSITVTEVTQGCMGDAFEPNDALAVAPMLATPLLVDAVVCDETDVDYYGFDAPMGGTLDAVLMSGLPLPVNAMQFSVVDANGVVLGTTAGQFGGDDTLTLMLPGPGLYFVRVEAEFPVPMAQPYTLRLDVAGGNPGVCTDDALEEDDTPAQATDQPINAAVAATFCPSDPDHFAYNLPRNQRFLLQLMDPQGRMDGVATVTDASGQLLVTALSNQPALLFQTRQRGRHVVRVQYGAPPAAGVAYQVMLSRP